MLPEVLNCRHFVNADEIARGLSPFAVEEVAFTAGRLMLQRIDELLQQQETFAIETTLATRSYTRLVQRAQQKGYRVVLLYFYLSSPEMAIERVAKRVAEGGHHIPEEVIRRRYSSGLRNFFRLYKPLVDEYMLSNNSGNETAPVVKFQNQELTILQPKLVWSGVWRNS